MQLLSTLYRIQSKSGHEEKMREFIAAWIAKNCPEALIERDDAGNVYITKGQEGSYPVIVAHMDQVQTEKNIEVLMHDDLVFGYCKETHSLAGLGADDKNGIWIALQCFLKFPVIKLAFFVSEETGCNGSRVCDLSFFDDARFVIQCDRKGNDDFVATACSTKLCTDKFLADSHLEQFKYKVCHIGGLTDVKTLRSRNLKVCSCNISCGYYDPHSDHETTDLKDLKNCLALVEYMVENMTEIYEFPVPKATTYSTTSLYPGWGGYQSTTKKKQKKADSFFGAGLGSEAYSSYEEGDLFEDAGYVGDAHVHVKRSKKQKVDAKSYAEQRSMAEIGLKEALLANAAYTPYEFYMENKNLLPNISYAVITQIFNHLQSELFK